MNTLTRLPLSSSPCETGPRMKSLRMCNWDSWYVPRKHQLPEWRTLAETEAHHEGAGRWTGQTGMLWRRRPDHEQDGSRVASVTSSCWWSLRQSRRSNTCSSVGKELCRAHLCERSVLRPMHERCLHQGTTATQPDLYTSGVLTGECKPAQNDVYPCVQHVSFDTAASNPHWKVRSSWTQTGAWPIVPVCPAA